MKPGSVDAAKALMEKLKGEIMGLPGMRQFYNVMAPDGSGYIVSLADDSVPPEANAEKIRAIWANFSELLEEMLTPETFDVIADWKNP
jgi:hypothetical protein